VNQFFQRWRAVADEAARGGEPEAEAADLWLDKATQQDVNYLPAKLLALCQGPRKNPLDRGLLMPDGVVAFDLIFSWQKDANHPHGPASRLPEAGVNAAVRAR
jgi:hypothetical protein